MRVFEDKTLSISYSDTLPFLPYKKIKEAIVGSTYELSILFAPPALAQTLNMEHRKKTYVPNTLSFPYTKNSGELVICRSVARREASKFDLSYHDYLLFLLIHSMLHLKGYEHGATMERLEAKHLNAFRKNNETTHHRRH